MEQPIHVLLVEDNPTDVFVLQEVLALVPTGSLTLTHVERLKEALQYLTLPDYDAVLLDLSLPDSQGLETFATIYAQAPDLPIVVFTGLADERVGMTAVQRELEARGIYVRTASWSGLAEEAGPAYKNIDDVIEVTERAGISKPVVPFLPIGNVKG